MLDYLVVLLLDISLPADGGKTVGSCLDIFIYNVSLSLQLSLSPVHPLAAVIELNLS